MAVDDRYAAYCLDQAVYYFGSSLRSELDAVEGKNARDSERKRQRILDQYLHGGKTKGRFRDPAATLGAAE